jgi:hypothetical protein
VTKRKPAHKEFKVTIDIKLPQDALDRIERAIQKAVLNDPYRLNVVRRGLVVGTPTTDLSHISVGNPPAVLQCRPA